MRKINVHHVFPPIPIRDFDYSACRDGNEEEGPHGQGRTAQAAIDNLIELESDLDEESTGG